MNIFALFEEEKQCLNNQDSGLKYEIIGFRTSDLVCFHRHHDPKQPGGRKGLLGVHGTVQYSRDHRGSVLTDLFPMVCSVLFLIGPRTTFPGMTPGGFHDNTLRG